MEQVKLQNNEISSEEARILIENIPTGACILEIEDGIINQTYVNNGFYRMLNTTREKREAYYGKNAVNSAYAEDKEIIANGVKKIVDGKDSLDITFRILQQENNYIWCRITGQVVRREGERITVYCAYTDVNEMMKLQLQLEQERKKQETLLAGIPGGVAIYRVKKNGKLAAEYVSDSLATMCGYTAADFLEYLRVDSQINLVPQDIEKVRECVNNSIKSNQPISVIYRIYTKKKKAILIRMDANVIHDELYEDDIAVLYAVHTLVSEDTKKVMQEQQHYRDIMNILGISYWEWSKNNGYYRSEKYSNYAISEEPNENIWDLEKCHAYIHPDDIALYDKYVKKEGNDSPRTSTILRAKKMDGKYYWTEMFAFAEFNECNGLTRIISVMRDVDKEWLEQKENLEIALKDAQKANAAKTEFLSTISHDMRTPLNGILGLTHLMQVRAHDEQLKNDLHQLENSGRYLLNLINDTLDVSKIESGELKLNPTVCDGKSTVHSILSLLKPNMEEKKIKFDMHIGQLPFSQLYLDVGRMEQVIMNIGGNAIKFSPEGGLIEFYMENISVKDGVITDQVIMKDYGIGMSEEFFPHIFEPFQQENSGNTTQYRGTGLGMTITKKIIELMGGKIWVESEKGKGTTVYFTIQFYIATKEQIEASKVSSSDNPVVTVLAGKRVLLCEDHSLNRQIAQRMLESKEIQVETAENGKIGVELFEKSPQNYYDAILMDIRMPKMDGLEATHYIRMSKHSQACSIPIIAMTANALDIDVQSCFDAGMNAHLPKPFEPRDLFRILEEQMQRENV